MIQRIQSLYLFLTTLLSLLFLKGSFLKLTDTSGSVIKFTFSGILENRGGQEFELIEKSLPLSVLLLLIPVLSFLTIFLFKKRRIQLFLSLAVIFLIIGFILDSTYYLWVIISKYEARFIPGFKTIIPILMLVFAILAYRGIKRDDDLVKSYDRLR